MAIEGASSNDAVEGIRATAPSDETVAAALQEALQNARLLRVSSSIFLKEAKELLDSGRAAALLWAADCLEGLNEVEQERLAAVKEATASNNVPLVSVQSKKQLAEWVGLGKIGRLRRNAACLLAVVLHSADGADSDEAPALSKLLENFPQAPRPRPKPIATQRVSSAGSKVTTPSSAKAHVRHSYTPDAVSFRAALSGKDTLPVLKRTSSSAASSRRESADGAYALPSWALSRRESLAAAEASEQLPAASKAAPAPVTSPEKPPSAETSKAAGTPAPAATSGSKAADDPAAPEEAASIKPSTIPAKLDAGATRKSSKGVASPGGNAASAAAKAAPGPLAAASEAAAAAGPVSKEEPAGSSPHKASEPAIASVTAAAPEASAAGAAKADASPEPSPAPKESPQKEQKEPAPTVNGKSSPKKSSVDKAAPASPQPATPSVPETPAKTPTEESSGVTDAAAKPAPASDAFTPGAGLPGTANSSAPATAEETPSDTAPGKLADRSASMARPEEVSTFRMARRKRTSSNAAAATPAKAAESDVTADGTPRNGSATAAAEEAN